MNLFKLTILILVVGIANVCASPTTKTITKTYSVKSENVSFKNGDIKLKGTLYLPENSTKNPAIVVFHSASGGTRNYQFYKHLKKEIPSKGFAVLLFDRRGSGESTGDFETADFKDLAKDGIAGIEFLKTRKEIDTNKIGVWGVSQGGWIAPLAATMSKDVSFVIIISGPGVSPAKQMTFAAQYAIREAKYSKDEIAKATKLRLLLDEYYRGNASREKVTIAVENARQKPWFNLAYLPNRGRIPSNPKTTKWFQEMDFNPLPTLSKVDVPMLVFFGKNDRWVPVKESLKRIKEVVNNNKKNKFYSIKEADHLMMTGVPDSGGPVSEKYLKFMLKWLKNRK